MKITRPLPSFTLIFLMFLCGGASSSIANAQTYKCTKNGTTTYTQSPCADGVSTPTTIPSGGIPAADYQEALKRNKKDEVTLKKLEDTRHKEEAKREKEMKALARKNESATQKCAGLHANEKWAKEDLANAQPKTEKKARTKYKRAMEKTALYCKASQ
jgi:type IV secretory pathway VirB10-like protein